MNDASAAPRGAVARERDASEGQHGKGDDWGELSGIATISGFIGSPVLVPWSFVGRDSQLSCAPRRAQGRLALFSHVEQHRLNFFPLPHGQGALRVGRASYFTGSARDLTVASCSSCRVTSRAPHGVSNL